MQEVLLCFLSIYRPVVTLCTSYCSICILWTFPRGGLFLIILTPGLDLPFNILNSLFFLINTSHVLYEVWTAMLHIKLVIVKYWKFMTRFINERTHTKFRKSWEEIYVTYQHICILFIFWTYIMKKFSSLRHFCLSVCKTNDIILKYMRSCYSFIMPVKATK